MVIYVSSRLENQGLSPRTFRPKEQLMTVMEVFILRRGPIVTERMIIDATDEHRTRRLNRWLDAFDHRSVVTVRFTSEVGQNTIQCACKNVRGYWKKTSIIHDESGSYLMIHMPRSEFNRSGNRRFIVGLINYALDAQSTAAAA